MRETFVQLLAVMLLFLVPTPIIALSPDSKEAEASDRTVEERHDGQAHYGGKGHDQYSVALNNGIIAYSLSHRLSGIIGLFSPGATRKLQRPLQLIIRQGRR